jgi:hypothetical protein
MSFQNSGKPVHASSSGYRQDKKGSRFSTLGSVAGTPVACRSERGNVMPNAITAAKLDKQLGNVGKVGTPKGSHRIWKRGSKPGRHKGTIAARDLYTAGAVERETAVCATEAGCKSVTKGNYRS